MTCSGVYVPCIYIQKDARLWSLCTLYLHAEGCTFVEFVYLVSTCRRLYRLWSLCTLYAERCSVCRVYVPCIYMKDVRFWSLCTLYLHAEGCTVRAVCVLCIYSNEGYTVCGVCVPCNYKQNGVQFVSSM